MDAALSPAHDVVAAALDDEIALLRPDSGDTLLLNSSAAVVWQACDGSRDAGAIVAELQQQFPGVRELADQVLATIDDLLRRGFLVQVSSRLDDRATSTDDSSG